MQHALDFERRLEVGLDSGTASTTVGSADCWLDKAESWVAPDCLPGTELTAVYCRRSIQRDECSCSPADFPPDTVLAGCTTAWLLVRCKQAVELEPRASRVVVHSVSRCRS